MENQSRVPTAVKYRRRDLLINEIYQISGFFFIDLPCSSLCGLELDRISRIQVAGEKFLPAKRSEASSFGSDVMSDHWLKEKRKCVEGFSRFLFMKMGFINILGLMHVILLILGLTYGIVTKPLFRSFLLLYVYMLIKVYLYYINQSALVVLVEDCSL